MRGNPAATLCLLTTCLGWFRGCEDARPRRDARRDATDAGLAPGDAGGPPDAATTDALGPDVGLPPDAAALDPDAPAPMYVARAGVPSVQRTPIDARGVAGPRRISPVRGDGEGTVRIAAVPRALTSSSPIGSSSGAKRAVAVQAQGPRQFLSGWAFGSPEAEEPTLLADTVPGLVVDAFIAPGGRWPVLTLGTEHTAVPHRNWRGTLAGGAPVPLTPVGDARETLVAFDCHGAPDDRRAYMSDQERR